jgi:hypothetical protein
MGLLDKLTGTARPDGEVPAAPADEVRRALLAVSGPDDPFTVSEGEGAADLTASWRIDEPAWRTSFEERGVDRLITVHMRLDAGSSTVHVAERTSTVTWRAGVAHLEVQKQWSSGPSTQRSWRATVGGDGITTAWSFSSDEMEDPPKRAATDAGWTWKPHPFGKL